VASYAAPILCALFVWWFSTGVVLLIVGLPRRALPWGLSGAGVLFVAALYGLAVSSAVPSIAGAYFAFTCAILVWGAQEIGFLTGAITGVRSMPCPEGCAGFRRARYAIEAILYHEVALILSGVAVAAVTWDGENQIGTWTFVILWTMRICAKLNLFLGVPVLNDEFLPEHLRHLRSFFARKPTNALFPIVVTVATAATTLILALAMSAEASPFEATGFSLLAALLALGVLEHWFMIVPLPIASLWSWGLRARAPTVDRTAVSAVADDVALRVAARNRLKP
jgi:putative photosynthetic complex assembly protein 2